MRLSLTEELQYLTIRIEVENKDGNISTGTGFIFNLLNDKNTNFPVIVSNRHVFDGGVTGRFLFTLSGGNGNPIDSKHYLIQITNLQSSVIYHQDINIDLAILPIGGIINTLQERGINVFIKSLSYSNIPNQQQLNELNAVESILMVGYPNGLWDQTNNLPLFRKGITATHPNKNYNGRPEFVIDAACFPGSSGSPVFLHNMGVYENKDGGTSLGSRFHFLGILYAGPQHTVSGEIKVVEIPTSNKIIPQILIPNNLGYVLKSNLLHDFKKVLNNAY